MDKLYITKADGTSEPFREEKLLHSLTRAGAKDNEAKEIVRYVVMKMRPGMTTQAIYRQAFRRLRKLHRPTAARYSLRRALFDLGPTGFPFEDFITALFEKDGYTTKVRQVIQGKCSKHELDVVATKGTECLAMELKFHNHPGTKTDTKVALYIHARMQDIFAVRNRAVDGCTINTGILLTNTKFTNNALSYAKCAGLTLIGWQFPQGSSLLDRMTRLAIYPITTLTTLSQSQKRKLIERGIILCGTLEKRKEDLVSLGLSAAGVDAVLEEIKALQAMEYTQLH